MRKPDCHASLAMTLGRKARCMAFTMAEILLSLTIIGVVAAITLPSLTGNINEKSWATQKKALYARMSQAIALMPSLNGYGIGATNAETASIAAETFITEGLAKVLKINTICNNQHLSDCSLPEKITNLSGEKLNLDNIKYLHDYASMFTYLSGNGGTYGQINTNAAAFITDNGESILVYYMPHCKNTVSDEYNMILYNAPPYNRIQYFICANFIYDLNGKNGPNTVGKDIGFMTALNPIDSRLFAPIPDKKDIGVQNITANGTSVCSRAKGNNYRMPTFFELVSMSINYKLLKFSSSEISPWASGTLFRYSKKPVIISLWNGEFSVNTGATVWCIKR